MKTYIFRYDPNATPDALFARVARTAKTGVPDVRENETSSNSIHAILSTMTEARLKLFYAIADQHPNSMYHLAQLLNRDQANVTRDVKALKLMGLIKLVSEKDGKRERLRPVASYDRIVFDFGAAKAAGKRKRA